jgi:D-cysteine desulfhydrase
VGALGYTVCAREIVEQAREAGLEFQHLVLAVGTAGTLAGVLLGLEAQGPPIPVTGISVSKPRAQAEATARVLIRDMEALLESGPEVPSGRVVCLDDYVGTGYARPTAGMLEAVALLARTEGILLDPTYTGKAMAGLVDLARQGRFKAGENVLFLHTGGTPGLFAQRELFPPRL